MNSPNPALISQDAVKRLPRVALLLFCAAYVLPGLFGRDPWRNEDLTAFAYMLKMAQGQTSWLAPTVGGLELHTALLPHWLGAGFIIMLSPWLDPPLAARLLFAGLLTLTLVLTWYTTFQLGLTDAAQPLPFAFGGEAHRVDYARAIADGALLALVASLGLLQLGHETTPELVQLNAVSLYLWGLSAVPRHRRAGRAAVLVALPALSASGAPAMALAMGSWGVIVHLQHRLDPGLQRFWVWGLVATAVSVLAGVLAHGWASRWGFSPTWLQLTQLARLYAWFLWPAWTLALWTLWRWRWQLMQRHLSIPLGVAAVSLLACSVMGGSDRALMLALPPVAVLAAFALPTFQRSTAAAIDWFSVFFFTGCAIFIWVMYSAMQTGIPARPAANIAKLALGFKPSFSLPRLLIAIAGTLAWLWLVRWRTGRHREAVWKSLVLPASGVALCWLLAMTLWLPALDYARSLRPWVARIARHVAPGACIATAGIPRSQVAALEVHGHYQVDATPGAEQRKCAVLLLPARAPAPQGWKLIARERRPTEREETTAVYRRSEAAGATPSSEGH
ncbi:MAG TPA: hypothetical protein VFP68_23615 [Burkholderiaceae bacterium]|nr:hypothetical protein [Burkholderiaceae bacterium]